MAIHHLHNREFLNSNNRGNQLFLAHLTLSDGTTLFKLVDLANRVHDTYTIAKNDEFVSLEVSKIGRPEIYLTFKNQVKVVKFKYAKNPMSRQDCRDKYGQDSLQFKFYSFRSVLFGREKLILKNGEENTGNLDFEWREFYPDAADSGLVFFGKDRLLK